jgi:hypothetical protein
MMIAMHKIRVALFLPVAKKLWKMVLVGKTKTKNDLKYGSQHFLKAS